MLTLIPGIHACQDLFRLLDHQVRPLGDDVQVVVGEHRGNLDDLIAVRHQPGHLKVYPDQILVIRHSVSLPRQLGHHSKECRSAEALSHIAACCMCAATTVAKRWRARHAEASRSSAATSCAASSIPATASSTWSGSSRAPAPSTAPMPAAAAS